MGSCYSEANTLENKVTHFDYSQFYFTYVEDGVTKTACLTDEALTPAHQMALLKEVYTNPNIPGIKYAYDYDGIQNRKIDYNYYGHLGASTDPDGYWMGSPDEFFPDPYLDGMTMLMVVVKETWKPSYHNNYTGAEYFENAIESIKLCPNFIRNNNGTNPGYLFSIDDVVANRFFFISKGKPRSSSTKPFYRLFEQISPVNDFDTEESASFIDQMLAGNKFNCYHDCTNVLSLTTKLSNNKSIPHWFSIDTGGEAFDLYNMSIYIPDRRHEDELAPCDKTDIFNNTSFFNEYGNSQNPGQEHEELMPHVVLYRAELEAEAVRSTTRGYYDINLDWSSAFVGFDVPEHYYVYQFDPVTKTRTLLATIPTQPTTSRSHTYTVPQQEDPQTFYYVITAAPIVYDNNGDIIVDEHGIAVKTIQVDSEICKVTVPGLDPFYAEDADYRSRFDILQQLNIYQNSITLTPEGTDDYARLKNNPNPFILTRTDEAGNKVTVATVQFSPNTDLGGYDYTVSYNGSTQDYVNLFDDTVTPITSGHFNNFDEATVTIIDRFSASTANNDHSGLYSYLIKQDNLDFSNVINVAVQKTTFTVRGVGHTKESVDDDTSHTLDLGPYTAVDLQAINDPLIFVYEYDLYHIRNNLPEKIGKAENTQNNGVYRVFGMSTDKALNENCGTVAIGPEGGTISIIDRNVGNNKGFDYVPIICTTYDRSQMLYNWYGCSRLPVLYPNVTLTVTKTGGKNDLMKSAPYESDGATLMAYQAKIQITPTQLSYEGNEYTPYRYRLWRDNGTTLTELERETLINDLPDTSGTSIDESGYEYSWGNDLEQLRRIYPGSGKILLTDLFTDLAITSSQKKTVKYIVRLYTEQTTRAASPSPRRAISDGDGTDFFIAQNNISVVFSRDVVTGVESVTSEEIESIVFYNTLGVASSEPHHGLNIIVTRYRDGRTTTERRIVR